MDGLPDILSVYFPQKGYGSRRSWSVRKHSKVVSVYEISVRLCSIESPQSDAYRWKGSLRQDRSHRRSRAQLSCYRWCFNLLAIAICSGTLSGCGSFFVRNNTLAGGPSKTAVPTLSLNATSVAFGWVRVNTSATQSVILTSVGTAPVTISAATTTGAGFTLPGVTFPVTLNPGQTLTLNLQFDPSTAGAATGQLKITSNSSTNGAVEIGLSGTGTSHQVELVWDAPASSADPIVGFRVSRSLDGGDSFKLITSTLVTQTSFVDKEVQSGLTYVYVVKSVDAVGIESAPSSMTSVTVP